MRTLLISGMISDMERNVRLMKIVMYGVIASAPIFFYFGYKSIKIFKKFKMKKLEEANERQALHLDRMEEVMRKEGLSEYEIEMKKNMIEYDKTLRELKERVENF